MDWVILGLILMREFVVTRNLKDEANRSVEPAAAPAGMLARSLRKRRKMTLEQVAQKTGLSRSHLSRYENGEKSLSIAALMRLSGALQTSVSALLGERGGEELVHIVRSGERIGRKATGADGNYEFIPLSRTDGSAGPNAFIVNLNATSTIGKEVFHEGDEMFFVLSGAVEIALASKSILLRQGDFVQFPGLVKHQLRWVEPKTTILVVVT